MIQFDQAQEIVLDAARRFPGEHVPLASALGRILMQEVRADRDMPPHNLSAMDGFACRQSDLDMPLTIIETIPAGAMPKKNIRVGQCARIMTGAPVPKGADIVIMVEHTAETDGLIRVTKKTDNPNIRYKSEDLEKGDVVLFTGTRITPAEIAVLAAVGCTRPAVAKKPVVGIIATGSELVEPENKPDGAKIRNSNGWQLCAQVKQAGCKARYYGIARDIHAAIDRKLKKALAECDVVLLSGGVSMGDYDYVPEILRANKINLLFEKIAIKPGKPTVFGIKGKKYFFGLPGNPVSTFVLFEMLVRPFLMKLMGSNGENRIAKLRLGDDIRRKHADRMEFRPVKFGADGLVYPIEYHGSAHINAYTKARGIVNVQKEVMSIEKGAVVDVVIL